MTIDGLRPRVPFNISDLASYIEKGRRLGANRYDAWLDYREIMHVGNLSEISRVLRADGVPFGVWSRPAERTCSIVVNLPGNGIAVELMSRSFGDDAQLARQCAASHFDLCAHE